MLVEDERLHRGRSGKVAVALGAAEGLEFLQFLVGPDDVSSEVVADLIGLVFPAASN